MHQVNQVIYNNEKSKIIPESMSKVRITPNGMSYMATRLQTHNRPTIPFRNYIFEIKY